MHESELRDGRRIMFDVIGFVDWLKIDTRIDASANKCRKSMRIQFDNKAPRRANENVENRLIIFITTVLKLKIFVESLLMLQLLL